MQRLATVLRERVGQLERIHLHIGVAVRQALDERGDGIPCSDDQLIWKKRQEADTHPFCPSSLTLSQIWRFVSQSSEARFSSVALAEGVSGVIGRFWKETQSFAAAVDE